MYKPRKIKPSELKLKNYPWETTRKAGKELSAIKESVGIVDEVVVRAGFVLDTLLGVEPNDVDLFYSLKIWKYKDWPGCECKRIRKEIRGLNLPVISSRKIDLGHILEGEIYFSPVVKTVGPFSHHIDIPDMLCIDKNGDIWGNDEAIFCINNRVGEIRYDGWLQHPYFPYIPEDFLHNKFSVFYILQVFRELRMIYTKKYIAVGPNLRLLFDASLPVFDSVLESSRLTKYIKDYVSTRNSTMNIQGYKEALGVVGVDDMRKYIGLIKRFL